VGGGGEEGGVWGLAWGSHSACVGNGPASPLEERET
jgi:hypothetical protein